MWITKGACVDAGSFAFLFVIRLITEDIAYVAVQNEAERVQRFGADVLAVLHAVQRVGGKPLLVNQLVFRHAFAEKRGIKWLIGNHAYHPKPF